MNALRRTAKRARMRVERFAAGRAPAVHHFAEPHLCLLRAPSVAVRVAPLGPRAHGRDLQRAPLDGPERARQARPGARRLRDLRAARRRDRAPGSGAPALGRRRAREARRGPRAARGLRGDARPPQRRARQRDPLALADRRRLDARPLVLAARAARRGIGAVRVRRRPARRGGDASGARRPHATPPGALAARPSEPAHQSDAAARRHERLATLQGDARPRRRAGASITTSTGRPRFRRQVRFWRSIASTRAARASSSSTAHSSRAAKRASDHLPILARVELGG